MEEEVTEYVSKRPQRSSRRGNESAYMNSQEDVSIFIYIYIISSLRRTLHSLRRTFYSL